MWRDMIINKVIQSEMKVTSITTDKIKIARLNTPEDTLWVKEKELDKSSSYILHMMIHILLSTLCVFDLNCCLLVLRCTLGSVWRQYTMVWTTSCKDNKTKPWRQLYKQIGLFIYFSSTNIYFQLLIWLFNNLWLTCIAL